MTDTNNKQVFQFTLGPVQGFVSQARRTRDFWAGSFILSWLSGTAIACIEKQGGKIQFPVPNDVYMRHLCRTATAQDAYPQQGSIPNRFKALTAEVPKDFNPDLVTQTVQAAWQALAETVWANDLQGLANDATRTIWQRQVNNFWEISWVLSEDSPDNATLLDRRKNWRNVVAPNEPGHKCMVMDGWQELSGVTKTDMKTVQNFWKKLASSDKTGIKNDLGEGEQLCAMAFIKRRFARYFEQVEITLHKDPKLTIGGWSVPSAVPSVSFIAAAPWLARVLTNAPIHEIEEWNKVASELVDRSELAHVSNDKPFEIDVRCVKEASEKRRAEGMRRHWAGLDGQIYFPSALENTRLFPDQKAAQKVLQQLQKLRASAKLTELPSPYYAILLMDGDQLGKHMGDKDKQGPISKALNEFTGQAGDIVRKHNGFLIYAGGDDVLALLPMDSALDAAAVLQDSYKKAFKNNPPKVKGKEVNSTLSGAIEYVHIRTPLTRVLQDAHQLLDGIAKEQTGRNAIAVRVWKPSGMALQWAMPWEKALDADGKVRINQLAEQFAAQDSATGEEGGHFSNKFFFRMQDLLKRFESTNSETLEKLLVAEYLHSWGDLEKREKVKKVELEERLEQLLAQCRQWQRPSAGEAVQPHATQPINPDGALLVRFLAQKGLGKENT